MVDTVVYSVGCVTYFLFFACDFYLAFTLNRLKKQHPAIDECAPDDDDPHTNINAIIQSVRAGGHLPGRGGDDNMNDPEVGYDDTTRTVTQQREEALLARRIALAASVAAPFFTFISIIAPNAMSWATFNVPEWLGYVSVIPALGVVIVYVMRSLRIASVLEVSKAQWLSICWFRLDVICIIATAILLSWGNWLIAGCLYGMDLYLAQRLLVTERRLTVAMSDTQLMRDEVSHREEFGTTS